MGYVTIEYPPIEPRIEHGIGTTGGIDHKRVKDIHGQVCSQMELSSIMFYVFDFEALDTRIPNACPMHEHRNQCMQTKERSISEYIIYSAYSTVQSVYGIETE